MIEIYEGRPGSYKSYSAVVRVINHILSGGVVATNMALHRDKIKEHLRQKYSWAMEDSQLIIIPRDDVNDFPKVTPMGNKDCPVLIVIEEAGRYFNSRDWAKCSRQLLDFLALSRHYFNDVILVDQSADNVDKQFRRLIQYFWRCRDLQKFSVAGINLTLLPMFYVGRMDYDGKTLLDYKVYFKAAQIYPLYDSYSLQDCHIDRLEMKVKKHDGVIKKEKRQKQMKMFGIIILLLLFAGWYLKSNKKEKLSPKDKPSSQEITQPDKQPSPEVDHNWKIKYQPIEGYASGRVALAFSDGIIYTLFERCPWGKVVRVRPDMIVMVDNNNYRYIINNR